MSICTAPIHEASLRRSGIARIVKGYHSFTCAPCVSSTSGMSHTCHLPSQPQLVLIYRPRRDGRLSRPCQIILLLCHVGSFPASLSLTPRLSFVKVRYIHLIQRLLVVNHHRRSAQVWHVFSRGISQFYLHTHTFIRSRNEPYLPPPLRLTQAPLAPYW